MASQAQCRLVVQVEEHERNAALEGLDTRDASRPSGSSIMSVSSLHKRRDLLSVETLQDLSEGVADAPHICVRYDSGVHPAKVIEYVRPRPVVYRGVGQRHPSKPLELQQVSARCLGCAIKLCLCIVALLDLPPQFVCQSVAFLLFFPRAAPLKPRLIASVRLWLSPLLRE